MSLVDGGVTFARRRNNANDQNVDVTNACNVYEKNPH